MMRAYIVFLFLSVIPSLSFAQTNVWPVYGPTSSIGLHTISWRQDGSGEHRSYRLHERVNGGSWTQVFSSQTNISWSSKYRAPGTYEYRGTHCVWDEIRGIERCLAGQPITVTVTAPPLDTVNYQPTFASRTWTQVDLWGTPSKTKSGDFNGDGFADIVTVTDTQVIMRLNKEAVTLEQSSWTVTNGAGGIGYWNSCGYTFAGDFNADGRTDLASANGGAVYVKLASATDTYHFEESVWNVGGAWGNPADTYAGDFNGDGRDDIASISGTDVWMKLSTGSGFQSASWTVTNPWGPSAFTFVGDFNGDGRADLATLHDGAVYVAISTGTGFTSQTWASSGPWGVSGSAVAGDFNGDGMTDIASPSAGSVYLKMSTGTSFTNRTVAVSAQWGASGRVLVGDFNGDSYADLASPDATNLYMKLTDPPVVGDGLAGSGTYFVRAGDLNNDGLRDLFVTGNSNRAVGDFILIQGAGQRFSIRANPTTLDLQTAGLWPISDVNIHREDYNSDGYFDFLVEDVDSAVPAAEDFVVLTTRNAGTAPTKLVTIDDNFRRTLEQITRFFRQPQIVNTGYHSTTCTITYVPILAFNMLSMGGIGGGSPWGSYWDSYYYNYPYITFVPVQHCISGSASFTSAAGRLIGPHGTTLANGFTCGASCLPGQINTARNAGYHVDTNVNAAVALAIATWAFRATVVLVADDVTGVGVIDDFLIPITAAIAGGAYVIYLDQAVLNADNSYDLGPNAGSTQLPSSAASDPFTPGPDCDPNDPSRIDTQVKAGDRAPSSRRLGDNLEKMGCGKPHADSDAHHIVPRKGNSPTSQNTRQLLKEVGIDVDEAANGVWLPRNENIVTRARVHRTLNTVEYEEAVYTRLLNARNAGRSLRLELDSIRSELLNNTFMF